MFGRKKEKNSTENKTVKRETDGKRGETRIENTKAEECVRQRRLSLSLPSLSVFYLVLSKNHYVSLDEKKAVQ